MTKTEAVDMFEELLQVAMENMESELPYYIVEYGEEAVETLRHNGDDGEVDE